MKKSGKLFSAIILTASMVSLLSTTAFAESKNGQLTATSNSQTEIKLSTKHAQYLKENPNAKTVVTGEFQKYTYENAPADVKAQYEADCKSTNKIPSTSDIIVVPVSDKDVNSKAYNIASAQEVVVYYVYYTSTTGELNIYGSDGSYYHANTNSDYVGYNNQTQGSAVYCVQIILDMLNYHLAVDGIFGSNTHNAVIDFQQTHGLSVDATVGPNTWRAMLRSAGLTS